MLIFIYYIYNIIVNIVYIVLGTVLVRLARTLDLYNNKIGSLYTD